MISLAIALFAFSAVMGLSIVLKWLSDKEASKQIIYAHGLVAAAALVILIVYAVKNPSSFPKLSILLFVIAALGGAYMFIRDLQKKSSPMSVAFVHGLLAVSGFAALLVFAFV